jgi:DNA-dependent RNA polymerase
LSGPAHWPLWLKHGIGRKLIKRNAMTYVYGNNAWGMAEQQCDDLMKPLADKVKSRKLKEHPFGADNGNAAAKYLASTFIRRSRTWSSVRPWL